jgi:quercetin dioxygenase-like cupin family protein
MKTVTMAGHELINTMQHDDPTELFLCQAFDLLEPLTEPPSIFALENIPELEPELESELIQWQNVVHSLAYDAPPLPMGNLNERIFQRINNKYVDNQHVDNQRVEIETIDTDAIDKNHEKTSLPLSKTISTWQKQAATAIWEPYIDGITISNLDLDLTSREVYCFVRLEPGAKFPRHRHTAPEELLMLEGNLIIDGHIYHPGDYIYSQPGSIHQPKTNDGCLVIVRASIDDQILDDEIINDESLV